MRLLEGPLRVVATWPNDEFDGPDLYESLLGIFFQLCQSYPLDLAMAGAIVPISKYLPLLF